MIWPIRLLAKSILNTWRVKIGTMVPVRRPRRSPIVVSTDSHVPVPASTFDILGEAEGLREGLFKVATHAGKILRFLRGVCTQQKLFDFARTSLLALGNQPSTGVKP